MAISDEHRGVEGKPLSGQRIVVTRSREQAPDLSDRLADLGAEVLEFPVIQTVEPDNWDLADTAITNLEIYDWTVFTSANAVERFFERMATHDFDARQLAGCRIAAVGPVTAARLAERGIHPDYVPAEYRGEGVLEGFCERGVGEGSRILIPRALEAREVLPDSLRERGAIVDVVPVYRTVPGHGDPETLARLTQGAVDVVTFTSSSTVKNFLELVEEGLAQGADLPDLADLMGDVLIASIGPVTSDTARERGLEVGAQPESYTIPGLVDAIVEWAQAN